MSVCVFLQTHYLSSSLSQGITSVLFSSHLYEVLFPLYRRRYHDMDTHLHRKIGETFHASSAADFGIAEELWLHSEHGAPGESNLDLDACIV